jgi:hypothetical protein
LKNKRLRLFLYPENCTENAPSFLQTSKKSPFEGGQWFFTPFLQVLNEWIFTAVLTAVYSG